MSQPVPASTVDPLDLQIHPAPNLGLAVEQVAEIQSFLESALPPCIEMDRLRNLQLTVSIYIMLAEEASVSALAVLLAAVLRELEKAGVPVLGIPALQPLRDDLDGFVALALPDSDRIVSIHRSAQLTSGIYS